VSDCGEARFAGSGVGHSDLRGAGTPACRRSTLQEPPCKSFSPLACVAQALLRPDSSGRFVFLPPETFPPDRLSLCRRVSHHAFLKAFTGDPAHDQPDCSSGALSFHIPEASPEPPA